MTSPSFLMLNVFSQLPFKRYPSGALVSVTEYVPYGRTFPGISPIPFSLVTSTVTVSPGSAILPSNDIASFDRFIIENSAPASFPSPCGLSFPRSASAFTILTPPLTIFSEEAAGDTALVYSRSVPSSEISIRQMLSSERYPSDGLISLTLYLPRGNTVSPSPFA